MSRRLTGQRGMSLVEATIILLVLMILTSVLAPSIYDFVNDAQDVKVKEDCEAIGSSIVRFVRDNGPCFRIVPSTGCTKTNHVNVLRSAAGSLSVAVTPATLTFASGNATTASWFTTALTPAQSGVLDDHLVRNNPSGTTFYPVPTQANFNLPGPRFGLGWRGAYLAPGIGPDPWGGYYQVNTEFLTPVNNPGGIATDEGFSGWNYDTICISPGRNQTLETAFNLDISPPAVTLGYGGTQQVGDDFIYVIAGSSR